MRDVRFFFVPADGRFAFFSFDLTVECVNTHNICDNHDYYLKVGSYIAGFA